MLADAAAAGPTAVEVAQPLDTPATPVAPNRTDAAANCLVANGYVTGTSLRSSSRFTRGRNMNKGMVIVVIEVTDVERSADLYRNAFGVNLHLDDHEGGAAGAGDRWTSGRHAAISWTESGYLHFAIYPAKEDGPSRGVQIGFVETTSLTPTLLRWQRAPR